MWKRWFPWRYFLKKIALAQGFIDPIALLAKLQRFAQPSEVLAPVELIRLATVLQARGLINVQAIQHNLDWVWPVWVNRQFDPLDSSFIPRAFSFTHINLTHRNWTAVGIPKYHEYAIIDPCGLLTPHYDGWSIDTWIIVPGGESLLPSHSEHIRQTMHFQNNLVIETNVMEGPSELQIKVQAFESDGHPLCHVDILGKSRREAWLVVALRPFNPEGVSSVDKIDLFEDHCGWMVNGKAPVYWDVPPDAHLFSNYQNGDVYRLAASRRFKKSGSEPQKISCNAGMATAAALFRIPSAGERKIQLSIPLKREKPVSKPIFHITKASVPWQESLKDSCELDIPDRELKFLYDAALRTMILHAPGPDVYPGPYTYKHFWFRDAAIILHAMLCLRLLPPIEMIMDSFPSRQTVGGHFLSQDGEWDSNGQALWIFRRYCELTGKPPKKEWHNAIKKGAVWIQKKRTNPDGDTPHAGLLPAGFSAEHLGPNDFYYWDDFWAVEGLRSAAYLMRKYGEEPIAAEFENEANDLSKAIDRSLAITQKRIGTQIMPSSPYRRLDTGSIGSLAAGYPLQLWSADDTRLLKTVEYLMNFHFVHGGFFHDMSHSGINPYLTLCIAQILMRHSDPRAIQLVKAVASLASQTGQWPEAIHPTTKGGCMGDGQHIWAAAEWALMIRNCFVREESPDKLILFQGIQLSWLEKSHEISFGKTATTYGTIRVKAMAKGDRIHLTWEPEWRSSPPMIEVHWPGLPPVQVPKGQTSLELTAERGERK